MLTRKQIDALPFHPGWDDGRHGFVWCRFDAIIDRERLLRAEVTWDSDGIDETGTFHSPELKLEANVLVRDEWFKDADTVIRITNEQAAGIIAAPPADLLRQYAREIETILAMAKVAG